MEAMSLMTIILLATALPTAPVEKTHSDRTQKKTGKYTLVAPAATKGVKRPGLLIWFHGAGGGPSYAGSVATLNTTAAKWNLATLAVQVPNGTQTWPAVNESPDAHVAYAHGLLHDVVMKDYEIDGERLVFVGFSAGSTFLMGDYLPIHATSYRGGAVMLCGGGPPIAATPLGANALPAGFNDRFKMYAYITMPDFLYQQTMQGVGYWQMRGATPEVVTPKTGGHCDFDLTKTLEAGLTKVFGPAPAP